MVKEWRSSLKNFDVSPNFDHFDICRSPEIMSFLIKIYTPKFNLIWLPYERTSLETIPERELNSERQQDSGILYR